MNARLIRIAAILKNRSYTALAVSTLSIGLSTPIILAEGKPTKPSIYDPPEEKRVLVREEPTQLEHSIRETRRYVLTHYYSAVNSLKSVVDQWIGVEKEVESTLHEIAPKGEETLLPGAIYVGIAGMGGSILARNRMFPIRILSPLLAIGLAGFYFLPETSNNIVSLTQRLEENLEERVPAIRDVHATISKEVEELKNETVKEVEQVTSKLGITTRK